MNGIFTYISHTNQPHVGKYTIHGSLGKWPLTNSSTLIRLIWKKSWLESWAVDSWHLRNLTKNRYQNKWSNKMMPRLWDKDSGLVYPPWKLTASLPLKIDRNPKGHFHLPTIHFQGRTLKLPGGYILKVTTTFSKAHHFRWFIDVSLGAPNFESWSWTITQKKQKRTPQELVSLRIQVSPKEWISPIILFWRWDWNPQSYSREVSGFLGS